MRLNSLKIEQKSILKILEKIGGVMAKNVNFDGVLAKTQSVFRIFQNGFLLDYQ